MAGGRPERGGTTSLRDIVAQRLGLDAALLDPDERLHRYGLTSLTAAALVADLSAARGRVLPRTLVWDYPTLRQLAGFLDGAGPATATLAPMTPMAAGEPVAVVGMACRLPGADSIGGFWDMLVAGIDAIREVPADRWPVGDLVDPDPLAPGRMATRWGGFLDRVDQFDAAFFGLAPREAAQADPQQRLALELAWEALEDAGIRPGTLSNSRAGVFMGAMWSDYARLLTDRHAIEQHTATGQDTSIVSARIAYTLGLQGPALTVNTACSSSLVAVHLACRSLRAGESTVALAGGVHLLLAPESSIAMTKFGAMAADGRCKPFDARADGYVRGEGGGVLVLKPLSAARADGDRVYAVIRGSAVNNDGPSNGLTAPNPAAQRAMLRDALADAHVAPEAVDYVEAHGTGTALGDPIEARALADCLRRDATRPLLIGSVKSNIGHLEAAAGAAGLIKLVLSLHHRWIPASLHFRSGNPAIDFATTNLRVPANGGPWPDGSAVPTGGVSSFGFGGTNCHLVVQAAPPLRHAGAAAPVFVFCGNGGNWPGMAAALLAEPAFAASLRDSDTLLSAAGYPGSVIEVLTARDDRRVEDVALGQPALCAFQFALTDLLEAHGVRPAAVIGHSVGEAAAASIAGSLTRADALRLVVLRSRLQAGLSGQGGMALATASAERVRQLLPPGVTIAGENGPRATLLAGARRDLDVAGEALARAGIALAPIQVPVAYHSPQMDALRPRLEADLATLAPSPGRLPMVSTVTGAYLTDTALDASYWGRNLRDPVLFRQGIATLLAAGHTAFIEIAPHPLLAGQIQQMAPRARVLALVSRGNGAPAALHGSLAALSSKRPRHLLVLSARSRSALDALAQLWAARLPDDFPDLCHTALAGRERFPWRLALHAASGEDARRRLLAGDVLSGRADSSAPVFDQRRGAAEDWPAYLDRCCRAFVAGADIDAHAFDAGEPWRTVSAPTYPFERERHWLPIAPTMLSYQLAWEPFTVPDPVPWPDVAPTAAPADPGLDAEATAFARAALDAVPRSAILARHRALADRLAAWFPPESGCGPAYALPGEAGRAAEGPAATLLRRAGEALPAVLTGRADPLDVLFPGGDMGMASAVYDAPPFAAAQQALADAIGVLAGGRPWRVMELGAGTGALTARLLDRLPAGSDLLCTDVSQAFLAGLRRRFGVRTAVFDLDRPDAPGGRFDAIVAANVVHAGADLGAILANLRDRLAPGGVLALAELVRAPRWIDLVFGLTEGWWRFAGDPRRPSHALLDAAGWRAVLEQHSFSDITIRPDGDSHALILCRSAAAPGVLHEPDDEPAAFLVDAIASTALPASVVLRGSIGHAAVGGAIRAMALDQPDRLATVFELADEAPASLEALRQSLGRTGAEDRVRIAGGRLTVPRIVRAPGPAARARLDAERLHIVAGGLGRLGFAFARYAVERGARHLLLLGRSPPNDALLAILRARGATVRYARADRTALPDLLDRPLGGLIHAAGRMDGTTQDILAAKLGVADLLEYAAAGRDPAFLLLFASAAGVWGTRGNPAYAAANAALDRWAEQARARGVPATAVAFGRFQEPGLLSAAEDAALQAAGLRAMEPDAAFDAALQAVAAGAVHRIVADVDWPRFRATFEARRSRPLLDRVAPLPPQTRPASAPTSLPDHAGALDRTGVAAIVADLLGYDDPAGLDPHRGLFEQGLDSLTAVALRRRLEAASGIPVPAAALFAQPTIAMLAGWLAGQARQVPAAAATHAGQRAPIAIIGIGCRFAGAVDHPDALLDLLLQAREAIGPLPPGRPDAASWRAAAPRLATQRGGFLDGIDQFDAAFFGISAREAAQLDPQQRILLEVAWQALEHAGIAPDSLAGSGTAVFVGATGSDYATLARAAGGARLDAHSLVGQPANTLSGRLAYQFGLHGPALTVDTACSSSLVALHLAIGALRRGEADMALACGVNLLLAPDTSVMLSRAGLLSPDGRCKVFDAAADGYVRGEGCGVVVLKTLDRAGRDGDRVLAVIRGSAVNHDGRSSSFTAPNGAAQAAVIRDALADAGLDPADIDYVEAHGTGTALGDPIELDALGEVFAERAAPLLVGSVKANLGHTEASAGIAGVIKAALSLDTGMLPRQINFARLNPHVGRLDGPVQVVGAHAPAPRRIGVSAFGASGTNAHVVMERAAASAPARGDGPPRLILAAATPAALERLRAAVAERLSSGTLDFADACHVACVGRARLPIWLLAETVAALATAPAQGGPPPVIDPPRGRRVPLPLTPFDRRPYWLDLATPPAPDARHPSLGEPRRSARSGETVHETRLDPRDLWLRDHVVDDAVLLPAAGFLDMALSAGLTALADIDYRAPVRVPPDGAAVQLVRDRHDVLALYEAHDTGWTEVVCARVLPAEPITAWPRLGAGQVTDGATVQACLAQRGFSFGPAYRLIRTLTIAGKLAQADIAPVPDAGRQLDPMLIDAAIQTLTALLPGTDEPWLPAHIGRMLAGVAPRGSLTALARLREVSAGRALGDAQLQRGDGTPVLLLEAIDLRGLPAQPGAWFHDVVWRPAAERLGPCLGRWQVIGPDATDETVHADVDGIIDLRPMVAASPLDCVLATAALVRQAASRIRPPQLVFVTRGASAAPPVSRAVTPAGAVLMGLQPVIAAEQPALRCRWVDLDPDEAPDETPFLAALAGAAGRFAVRQGRVLVPDIVKVETAPAGPVRLTAGAARSFTDLRLERDAGRAPAADEVQIAVAAAGLNFKDALAVLGRAPGPLGLECAGEVIAVGARVAHLAPGDAVIGFGQGCLASRVTLPATRVVKRPAWLDAATAASLPVAALTAWHGLHDIAAIAPGMRVLVHAGAGGVGSMAVRLARLAGARVFATVSDGKAAAARAAGAEATADSRSDAFAAPARRWAGPAGFDIVLNALGQAIADASADLLKPGGVFLEIGTAPAPRTGAFRYVAYDLDRPIAADPSWFAARMERILSLLRDGALSPPRRAVLPATRAGDALQALAQGRTIGKQVLLWPRDAPVIHPDGTYLVTGGTGAVGRAMARWLVQAGAGQGAGRVVLAARHATPDRLFETVSVDVGDASAMARLLDTLPNLRGVIHAAGIVRDRTLQHLTEAEVAAVMSAKVTGAANLDALTHGLDFFLLVSSTAGGIAAPGQAAYAAANAWLDALAQTRRAAGLPATAIASGPWRAGMFAALDAAARAALERDGFRAMAPARAAAAFARVLADDAVNRIVMDRTPTRPAAGDAASRLRDLVLAAPPADRPAILGDALARRVAALLGYPAGTLLDPARPLRDMGLDSLLSVSLRNEIAAATGLDIPATTVFDHPTIAALAAHLLALLVPEPPPLEALDERELADLLAAELELPA